ncbi:MAG: hypothetical protein IPN13_23830 [Bacteroidetes bacterium]|nr:hypothetical protein [Bacteroidota bacterium]
MNMKLTAICGLIAGSMLFSACDNDIDLLAPYKEIGVVYGLINPKDTVQYVRIQRAFLGRRKCAHDGSGS